MHGVTSSSSSRIAYDRVGRRLSSLDLLRGLTVLGMVTVNAVSAVADIDGPVFSSLLHARWAGFTIADAVFPAFIFMLGVSIAIATGFGDRSGRAVTGKILGRAIRLVLLGLVLTNMFWLSDFVGSGTPRLPGVLQRIGIVYAVTALLYQRTGWRARAALAAGVLLLYWPLSLIPSPDGLATDLWVPGHDFVSWVDRSLFGRWGFAKGPAGFDPEGLLSTLPTIAEALIGTLAGDYLRRALPPREAGGRMALVGGAMMAVGLVWGLVFPIAKNLWTSSFVLLSAGLALVLLGALHARFDLDDEPPRHGGLLGSFGRNAIAAYTLHEVGSIILAGDAIQLPFVWLAPVIGTKIASLAPVAIFVALVWWPISYMDRRGWYLKI
jgi:predicted acyltransferase